MFSFYKKLKTASFFFILFIFIISVFLFSPSSVRAEFSSVPDAITSLTFSYGDDVNDIAVSSTTIYIAGYFTAVNGSSSHKYLVAIDRATGSIIDWFDPVFSNNGYVEKLALSANGSTLYIGGSFETIDGSPHYALAAINTSTGEAISLFPVGDSSDTTWGVGISPDNNTLYAVGGFYNFGFNRMIAIDLNTGLYKPSFLPDFAMSGDVYTVTVSSDNSKVYAGGSFTAVYGDPYSGIVALNASDGTVISAFNPGTILVGQNDMVVDITLSPDDSVIYLGGRFQTMNGQTRRNIGALNTADGSVVSAFDPNPIMPGQYDDIYSISLSSDGTTLYLGSTGEMTSVGGAARSYVAAVNTSNGLATAFNPTLDNYLNTVNISPDGLNLYIGGGFTNIGGNSSFSKFAGFSLLATAPNLAVPSVSSTTATATELNGNITNTGGATVTIRGFNYGTTTAYGSVSSTTGSYSTGIYSQSISDLSCNTTYHFQSFATNSQGTATSSDATFLTSACVPGTPTDLIATAGDGQVSLSWTAPGSDGGSAITDYLVEYKLSTEPTTWTIFSDGTSTSTSAVVTSLTNSSAYNLRVSAVNTGGNSIGVEATSTPVSSGGGHHSGGGSTTVTTESCDAHGDINKDGKINLRDFSILLYFWGQTKPSNACADINQDGIVNLKDFSVMLYWWTN